MNPTCQFSEKFLQIVWNEGMLLPTMHCTDGSEISIISKGIWNTGAGPDFKNAAVIVNGRLFHGDIEIHRFSSDWHHHNHDEDPGYHQVVLHVVWQDDCPDIDASHSFFTLEISSQSSLGWDELSRRIDETAYAYGDRVSRGGCAIWLASEDNYAITDLLNQASLHRLKAKTSEFCHQCNGHNDNQILYEKIFDALGYGKAREQFTALAKIFPITMLEKLDSQWKRAAYLFGFAGLLPDPTQNDILPEFCHTVNEYWKIWWESGLKTMKISWPKSNGRPFNSPHRRLQAGLEIITFMGFRPGNWLRNKLTEAGNPNEILDEFFHHDFGISAWTHAMDFCHSIKKPGEMLGHQRRLDMAINIFIPYLLAMCKSKEMSQCLTQLWHSLPKSQDNRLLTIAAHRFFNPPSRSKDILKTGALQQGLLHIYKTYCLPLNHDCASCPLNKNA